MREVETEIHDAYDHAFTAIRLFIPRQEFLIGASLRERLFKMRPETARRFQTDHERFFLQSLILGLTYARRHDPLVFFSYFLRCARNIRILCRDLRSFDL